MFKKLSTPFLFLTIGLFLFSLNADAKKSKKRKKSSNIGVAKSTPNIVNPTTTTVAITPNTVEPLKLEEKKQEEKIILSQLVVSFVSRGFGIDTKGLDDFFYFMEQFNTKHNIQLMHDYKTWGREGERDYCFVGNSQLLIEQFYAQLKKHFEGNKLVFINLNAPCKK